MIADISKLHGRPQVIPSGATRARIADEFIPSGARNLLLACLLFLCAGAAMAGLTLEPGNTMEATANSVWNFKCTWQNEDGLWPVYMPDPDTDYNLQPDPMDPGRYNSSAREGVAVGSSAVQTKWSPLPASYVWYAIPAVNSLDGSVKLKINKGILQLDPARTDPNDADPRYPDRPGINSPLLGVYQSRSAGGVNLFVPGKYTDQGRYGVITIDPDRLPSGGIADWTNLYVRVSTNGVDGVYTYSGGSIENSYARRIDPVSLTPQPINYFRQLEWMPGVITGTWQGPGANRPPSPADSKAYTVTPSIDPNSIEMRSVTGIYLPQLMSGVVYDSTHVVPADTAKIGMVLGVFALSSQTGARYDDTHVNPSNPSVMTFVSAVYAQHTMSGAPIDANHVSPAASADIRRVLSVKVPGSSTEYYDPLQHPWTPGDTVIALKDGLDLPPAATSVVITYETVNLYDPEDPALAWRYDPTKELTRYIALAAPLPEGANTVRIVYGVGTGLDGFNYYDPQNTSAAFLPGETQINLRQALPADVTDVRILYGTDQQLETRGTVADSTHVVPPNIWRIGRVAGVWAIQEQDGIAQAGPVSTQTGTVDTSDPLRMRVIPSDPDVISKLLRVYDSSNRDYYGPVSPANPFKPGDTVIVLDKALPVGINTVTIRYEGLSEGVTPYDQDAIRGILGVYAVREMPATRIDNAHIAPQKPLSIRSVRAAYAIANQPGIADPNDVTRLSAIPSTPALIGRVLGVYDNPQMTGANYFDSDSPETTFRPGDAVIKLSTPLPDGVSALTVHYETIDLGPSYVQGETQITLATALPQSDPAIDPVPIRVVYVNNLNHAIPNTQSPRINFRTPLPAGTVDVTILYVDVTNRYGATQPGDVPLYAPGEENVTLPENPGLPADAQGAHIEYTAHLFAPSYDPFDYDPNNPSTYQYRPFIPGDKVVRLNRIDAAVPLWTRYTTPGALKLCIAYQSNKKARLGDYWQSGYVELPVPLPDDIPSPYIDYRVLSTTGFPNPVPDADPKWLNGVKEPPKENLVIDASYTVGIPYMGRVQRISFHEPDPLPHPLPQIDANGRFRFASPVGATGVWVEYRRQEPDTVPGSSGWRWGVVWIGLGGKYRGHIPLYIDSTDPAGSYDPKKGVVYRVATSAGLNLSDAKQQPSCNLEENYGSNTNRPIFDPRGNPMWYSPKLRIDNWNGVPTTYTGDDGAAFTGIAYKDAWVTYTATQDVTVHDARVMFSGDMVDHGGVSSLALDIHNDPIPRYGKDYLVCSPVLGAPDPLIIEPVESTPSNSDDGPSSAQFVFRCKYMNRDGLPPLPWLHTWADPWNNAGLVPKRRSGVVLYLDATGTGDYQPHFMGPEDPNVVGSGAVYIYRVIPRHVIAISTSHDPVRYPWPDYYNGYDALACGTYHYFFACSDDSLEFDPDRNYAEPGMPFDYQPDGAEWGDNGLYSSGLDPSMERSVTGFGEIDRPAHRGYSSSGTYPYDSTIHVDRAELVPGLFGHWYQNSADSHPRVTCELRMPSVDELSVPYDDAKYGYGRFLGTIDPFYRAVNPLVKWPTPPDPNDPLFRGHLMIAESTGATSKTDNVFRILYKQIDNKPPIYMRVHINNASYKSGAGAEYAYTAYTMYPRANQTPPYDYRNGVWYEYKTKLPPGPHTYYFQASDGEQTVRFPVRPDKYIYDTGDDPAAKAWYEDWWVPTDSVPSDRGKPGYFDNDYFPGPYVNHPCVISGATVTPGTGKEGQSFRYRLRYSDADGQAPYSAYIYIETNNRGDVRRLSMVPENPFSDPAADHSQDYINGVYYVLDTGTVKDLALENGVRRFYFEFTDNWGPYYDLNDRVQGEMTRLPEGAGNWITGPVISGNRPPTLTQGGVTSQDGTANAATLWTFKATYRDLDNDPPALVKVYTGLLHPDGRTVVWDDGHTMQPSNPGDNVYSDGAEYYFQTRLGAAESAASGETKQYFHAFEAYDGVDWATYSSSSNDEQRSNSANCFVLDDLVRIDPSHYKIRPLIVQQASVVTTSQVRPDNPGDILRVWGVYLTEDVNNAGGALGTNYCDLGADPPDFAGDGIALTSALPAATTNVWVNYEARSPIVGPLPIDLPAPAGVIPDAQIYENYAGNPVPILIDDQKNGWINDDPAQPEDRGTLRMRGVAAFEGQPSVNYVTPDHPRDIASVEGVYLAPDLTGDNFYDPAVLETPMFRTGTRDTTDSTRKTVIPDDPDRIVYVTGVFDPNDPNPANPVNYFKGGGYPSTVSWQQAIVVGGNTVWPKDPNDIVSIKGIYLSGDDTTANYYREDGLALQTGSAYGYLAQPQNPQDIARVLGIYLTQSDQGTDYYNGVIPPVQFMYNLTPDLPAGTTVVYINYEKAGGGTAWQSAIVYIGSLRPIDDRPIGKVIGVYTSVQYDGTGKPSGVGTNHAPNSTYSSLTGEPAIRISPPRAVSQGASMYIIYESLPLGFGPYNEYLGASKDLSNVQYGQPVYVAYYPRAPLTEFKVPLTSALPAGVDQVQIRCIAEAFNCGDSVIPLTKDLPDGTQTVYIKYADIRFTHQFRGQAHQPFSETTWRLGTTHFSPDGWETGSADLLWMSGAPLDPMTVKPLDPNAISAVEGVYDNNQATGTDYHAGSTVAFSDGDQTIMLGRPLPAGTGQVWIRYSPRSVHIKGNLTDITSGMVGAWLNASRDGAGYFNPRLRARYQDNPKHLRLTTPVPSGTYFIWARAYQKGDYHIDRWNRDVVFLPGKEKEASASIVASYFFGTRMPRALGPNTPPTLTQGKVNKLRGSRSDSYVFSVTYRDLDGPNGQAPVYIRCYIDGAPYDMTSVAQGTPPYREGAAYTFTPPEGLSGGSHKFHFEASDGADVAIYDWYDENAVPRPTTGQTVRDIDGPWVNNPPELTDGLVSPNPTTGGINPWDSVDYFVTYTDADNDEPYFHDPARDKIDYDADKNGMPDGQEWSGSPRAWIDSGVKDVVMTGAVQSLEDDPMSPGKKRTIVVAGDTQWTADEFAGKLIQITNGAISGRVYLVQSNTDKRLVIATEDLAADGVKTAADGEASTFRINGLLMSKADPTQQDFTAGVRYKVTVPKLAVGSHKFHFTAMSRETKPQWLLAKLEAKDQVPYSIKVQYPASGDDSGPTVISTPPQGNTAPTLSNTAETSLYVGPMAQLVLATTLGQVEAWNAARFATIREVRGVFENANDFDLGAVADDAAKNYYDPKAATVVFKPGDTKIVLTKNLPVGPAETMVQFGTADTASLGTVAPDVANVIDSVLGVCLVSDRALAGTDYFKTADGTGSGTFDAATGVITLRQPLPSGTRTVYVKYAVKAGLTWTSNPSVPVYVKHFSTTNQTVFQASDLVTFRINYKDADNDPPNYHDGVQGYVKVVFNSTGESRPMQLLNWTGGVIDYRADQVFTTGPINAPEGIHKYHFEASDGYFVSRWPQGTPGDPAANDYQIKVNHKPVISAGRVDPTAGQTSTPFEFKVTYKDQDGPGKNPPQVYARITRIDGTQGYLRKAMSLNTSNPNYPQGAPFHLVLVPSQAQPALEPGQYKVVFEATDGDGQDAVPFPLPDETQVFFTIRDTNTAPELSSPAVEPAAGKLNTTFIYEAIYKDAEGDAPIGKLDGQKDVMTLTVDKGLATEQSVRMTKAASAPAGPTPDDYKNGILYDTSKTPISGKKLGAGRHTFEVSASDGTADATPVSAEGPVLLIPYFDQFRAVDAAVTDPDAAPALTVTDVGKEVVFVGNMKFPDNSVAAPPAQITNITITVTKPDSTAVSLAASISDLKEEFLTGTQQRTGWTAKVRAAYPAGVDPSLITGTSLSLTASGDWTVAISWPGDSVWDRADNAGREVKISVGGPMRTAAVADPDRPDESTPLVDMITPPKVIGSSDVGLVFGYERALDMQIVRWDPGAGAYFRYGMQGIFPELKPGQAVWIKPKASYSTENVTQAMVDSGLLSLGNPGSVVNEQKRYRVVKAFVKDYDRDTITGRIQSCAIPLQAGWNQIGSIFQNWKRNAVGNVLDPKEDVGIPVSEITVRYLSQTKSLADASAAGWIRDYAWRYDPIGKKYVMVHATVAGAERVFKAWNGYWIRAFVDCELLINPNTTFNGTFGLKASEINKRAPEAVGAAAEETTLETVDMPPPAPE